MPATSDRGPLTPSRNASSIHGGSRTWIRQCLCTCWRDFIETLRRHACQRAFLERFSRSQVKGQGHMATWRDQVYFCDVDVYISTAWTVGSRQMILSSALTPQSTP